MLLATVDTLRADHVGGAGSDVPTAPFLDALLAEGVAFERAVTPIARTTPALASLLAGAYPHRTGVRTLTGALPDDVTSLPQVLRDAGYRTLAVVSNTVLAPERRLGRGFDVYDWKSDVRAAPQTTRAALEHLELVDRSRPLFAWVHYIDPHTPYHPDPALATAFDPGYTGPYRLHFGWHPRPGEPAQGLRTFPEDLPKGLATHRNPLPEAVTAHVRRLYAADVRGTDDALRELVAGFREALGDELLIVVTADHGESLGEHDFYWDHGDYVYNAGTRVPLGIVLPRSHALRRTGRCEAWVSLVDLAPTLLELLDVPPTPALAAQWEGRSLVPCLRDGALPDAPVFAESGRSYYPDLVRRRVRNDVAGRFRSVTRGNWKLVWTPFREGDAAWELYDLRSDPHETRDLYRADHPEVGALRHELETWLARGGPERPEPAVSPADRERLHALGYAE